MPSALFENKKKAYKRNAHKPFCIIFKGKCYLIFNYKTDHFMFHIDNFNDFFAF